MKTIVYKNNFRSFDFVRKALFDRNSSDREVIFMNLISSIVYRDYDKKNKTTDLKAARKQEDLGLNLYNELEYGQRNSSNLYHNLQMDMISNKVR